MRPLILDLFCGLGGAAVGYHRAGFDVIGVDRKPQPDYPFRMVVGNALDLAAVLADALRPVAVHASPPCQARAAITKGTNAQLAGTYADLLEPTRAVLTGIGAPSVIETTGNRADVTMCGAALGLSVIRHRTFELDGWSCPQPAHPKHRAPVRGWRHRAWFDGVWPDGRTMLAVYGNGSGRASLQEARDAMGIDWATDLDQLREAIPPAYTEYVGRHLLAVL